MPQDNGYNWEAANKLRGSVQVTMQFTEWDEFLFLYREGVEVIKINVIPSTTSQDELLNRIKKKLHEPPLFLVRSLHIY